MSKSARMIVIVCLILLAMTLLAACWLAQPPRPVTIEHLDQLPPYPEATELGQEQSIFRTLDPLGANIGLGKLAADLVPYKGLTLPIWHHGLLRYELRDFWLPKNATCQDGVEDAVRRLVDAGWTDIGEPAEAQFLKRLVAAGWQVGALQTGPDRQIFIGCNFDDVTGENYLLVWMAYKNVPKFQSISEVPVFPGATPVRRQGESFLVDTFLVARPGYEKPLIGGGFRLPSDYSCQQVLDYYKHAFEDAGWIWLDSMGNSNMFLFQYSVNVISIGCATEGEYTDFVVLTQQPQEPK